MKLQVCVAYNQQGINLTQKKAHVFIIESDTTLDEKEIAERIYKEVPEVLIDSYSVGFSLPLIDVKVGDVLKMVQICPSILGYNVETINNKICDWI